MRKRRASSAASGSARSRSIKTEASVATTADKSDTGVFFYLNGLLCRTADDRGCFRPADVFTGPDRVPKGPAAPVPSLEKDTADGAVLQEGAAGPVAIESDCPLLEVFGVVSGGVLIDPFRATFADMTQQALYNLRVQYVEPAARTANELAYRRGSFENIRPECALTLCASEMPLPPPAPTSKAAAAADAAARVSHRSRLPATAPKRSTTVVRTLHRTLAASTEKVGQIAAERRRTIWADAEHFRRSLQLDPAVHAQNRRFFFRARMPFLYRDGNGPIELGATAEGETTHAISAAAPPDEVFEVPPLGVRSSASSFVCYSGSSAYASHGHLPRPDAFNMRNGSSTLQRLQHYLRPYEREARDAPTGQRGASSPPTEEEDGDDRRGETEVVLAAPSFDEPRELAYRLLRDYFYYLGVLCDGRRLMDGTALMSTRSPSTLMAPDPDPAGKTWGLCLDRDYDVALEVERKRRDTEALRKEKGASFPGGSRWSTGSVQLAMVTAAWTTLLTTHRAALLQRIHRLYVYLRRMMPYGPFRVE